MTYLSSTPCTFLITIDAIDAIGGSNCLYALSLKRIKRIIFFQKLFSVFLVIVNFGVGRTDSHHNFRKW